MHLSATAMESIYQQVQGRADSLSRRTATTTPPAAWCHGIEESLSLCCHAAWARRKTMHDSGGRDEGCDARRPAGLAI